MVGVVSAQYAGANMEPGAAIALSRSQSYRSYLGHSVRWWKKYHPSQFSSHTTFVKKTNRTHSISAECVENSLTDAVGRIVSLLPTFDKSWLVAGFLTRQRYQRWATPRWSWGRWRTCWSPPSSSSSPCQSSPCPTSSSPPLAPPSVRPPGRWLGQRWKSLERCAGSPSAQLKVLFWTDAFVLDALAKSQT